LIIAASLLLGLAADGAGEEKEKKGGRSPNFPYLYYRTDAKDAQIAKEKGKKKEGKGGGLETVECSYAASRSNCSSSEGEREEGRGVNFPSLIIVSAPA